MPPAAASAHITDSTFFIHRFIPVFPFHRCPSVVIRLSKDSFSRLLTSHCCPTIFYHTVFSFARRAPVKFMYKSTFHRRTSVLSAQNISPLICTFSPYYSYRSLFIYPHSGIIISPRTYTASRCSFHIFFCVRCLVFFNGPTMIIMFVIEINTCIPISDDFKICSPVYLNLYSSNRQIPYPAIIPIVLFSMSSNSNRPSLNINWHNSITIEQTQPNTIAFHQNVSGLRSQ